jgi:hypothetical protein
MEPKYETYEVGGLGDNHVFASEQDALDFIQDRLVLFPSTDSSKIRLYKVIPIEIKVIRTILVEKLR